MPNNTPQTRTTGGKPTLISKPNLSSNGQQREGDWADSRILSSSKMGPLVTPQNKKKHSTPAATASSGLGLKLVFALSGVAVVVFFGYLYMQDQRYTPYQAVAPVPTVTDVAVLTPAEPSPPEPAVVEQPAEIQTINEPAPTSAVVAPSPASLTNALEADVQPPPAALEKALQANSAPVAKDKPAVKKKASPALAAPAAVAAPKVAAAPTVAPVVASGAAMTPAAVAVASEKDVSLLAALVAHNNTSAAKSAVDPSAATPARPVEESAEALLRRCAALESDRQPACRVKACSGPRASDPVCKAQTGTAAPAATPAPAPAPAAQSAPTAPASSSGGLSSLPTSFPTMPTLPELPTVPSLAPAQ